MIQAMHHQTLALLLLLPATLASPLPAQTAAPPPANDEVVTMAPFVVNALTDERNRSIEQKRHAETIGDYLSTDRLGQFVDSNIGSVVERLPGVYTSGAGQSGGDGISIRGLGGGFNSLQVDGDRLPSNQGETRAVSIDNIPAELIGAIEVVKAPTPEREADSIGGIVNVGTKSGLDLKRRLVAARATCGFDDYGGGDQWRASVSYSDRLAKNLGIFASVSHSASDRLRDEVRVSPDDYLGSLQLATNDTGLPTIEEGDNAGRYFSPGRVDYRRTRQKNRTTGMNLNLDWQARPDWRLSLRAFHTQFKERRPQLRNLWRFDCSADDEPEGQKSTKKDYVFHDDTDGTFYFANEQRIQRRIMDQDETEKNLRLQLEGAHRWAGSTLDYSASHGRSKRNLQADMYNFLTDNIQMRVNYRDAHAPDIALIAPGDAHYGLGASGASTVAPDFNDPAIYRTGGGDGEFKPDGRRAETIAATDEITAYAINYKKMLNERTTIKAGAKYRIQNKDNARDYTAAGTFAYSPDGVAYTTVDGFLDGHANLGLFPAYSSLHAQNPQSPREFIDSVLYGANPPGDTVRDSTVKDIGAREEILALYAQASYKIGPFSVLGGVRWEQTDGRYSGYHADVAGPLEITPVTTKHRYDDFYPSIHFTCNLADNMLARLSVGRTLSRPSFEDINPSTYATKNSDDATRVDVMRGNADLKPARSTNVDLSIEYYFKGGGMASIAGFYKQIDNWVYERTAIYNDMSLFPEYQGIGATSVAVNSYNNGDSAGVYGVEFNFQKPIGRGFSFGANFTALNFNVNEAQTGLDRVPGQAGRLIRVSLDYESKKFIARLALRDDGLVLDEQYSYTSPAAVAYFKSRGIGKVTHVNGAETINLGVYDKPGARLEMTAEYALTRNVRLFAQMNNLLGKNPRALVEKSAAYVEKNEYRSWTAILGVKINL
ncbi:MAG: TonB-dependent receptor [Opitutaceae bacterium]|jgi:TonB-dependent receptor|nr:TonB-dependent receptor [Opitutaceae bacterium]